MSLSITIPEEITVTYDVNKCEHERFNGSHTEIFDLSKLSSEDVLQYLAQTLVIKRQGQCRSKTAYDVDKDETKLTLGTWTVPAPGKRISTTPEEKVLSQLEKMDPAARRAFILAQLDAMDALEREEV